MVGFATLALFLTWWILFLQCPGTVHCEVVWRWPHSSRANSYSSFKIQIHPLVGQSEQNLWALNHPDHIFPVWPEPKEQFSLFLRCSSLSWTLSCTWRCGVPLTRYCYALQGTDNVVQRYLPLRIQSIKGWKIKKGKCQLEALTGEEGERGRGREEGTEEKSII